MHFIYFSWPTELARISSYMLSWRGKSVVFFIEKVPLSEKFIYFYNEFFIMDFEYFQMLFYASDNKVIWFFLFSLLIWWVTLINFLAYPE